MAVGHADLNLEVVFLPVSDVDRSKEFYKFPRRREDADIMASDDLRIVALAPPGSGASTSLGTRGHHDEPWTAAGTAARHGRLEATRAERVERGAPVSDVFPRRGRTVPL